MYPKIPFEGKKKNINIWSLIFFENTFSKAYKSDDQNSKSFFRIYSNILESKHTYKHYIMCIL